MSYDLEKHYGLISNIRDREIKISAIHRNDMAARLGISLTYIFKLATKYGLSTPHDKKNNIKMKGVYLFDDAMDKLLNDRRVKIEKQEMRLYSNLDIAMALGSNPHTINIIAPMFCLERIVTTDKARYYNADDVDKLIDFIKGIMEDKINDGYQI